MTAASRPRCPTQRQFEILMILGGGSVLLTGRKREVEPMLRRGWVTADHGYAWVRITAEGFRALALAVEKFGMPEMQKGHRAVKVCGDCDKPWNPRCKCGSRHYRSVNEEVERVAA